MGRRVTVCEMLFGSIDKLNELLAKHRLMRMFVAGGINTVFGFLVFAALSIGLRLPTPAALLIALICGTLFNFLTTGHYVFRQLSIGKYPRFLACYLLLYLINLGLVRLLHGITTDDVISQAILSIPMALLSYLLMARMVFNRDTTASGNGPSDE